MTEPNQFIHIPIAEALTPRSGDTVMLMDFSVGNNWNEAK